MRFRYIAQGELLVHDAPYGPRVLSEGDEMEGPDEWEARPDFEAVEGDPTPNPDGDQPEDSADGDVIATAEPTD